VSAVAGDLAVVDALVDAVRRELAAAADPARAPDMQRYMKSAMPFHGVASPQQKAVFARVLAEHRLSGRAEWEAAVRALWSGATHREERYAALAVTGHRDYRDLQTPESLPLYAELIVDGAWWDYVDLLAIHRVGPLLRGFPDVVRPVVEAWSTSPDRWLRRTSVICQVGSKEATDVALLERCVAANLAHPDFFVRKGIGWALRQHARADPDWVRSYVAAHEGELSPLSRREAMKHLG
jgi:3-methyladenine DNA glycosylase AlkD